MLGTCLHPSIPSLGCTGAHECSDPRRPRVPLMPSKQSKAKPARDADRPLMRDDTQWQTQLWWIQSRKSSGKKMAAREVHTAECPTWKTSGHCKGWCGREAAGLSPSGQECWLFAATLKTPSQTVSLLSETIACGSGDRQQPKAAWSQAASPPQRDWAAAPLPRDGRAGVTGRAGAGERSASSICVAVARGVCPV